MLGEERVEGDITAGSEFVARWREEAVGDDGPASASASGRYVEMDRVRFDGRWKRRGTEGSVADGAGLGDGRVSREVLRKIGENARLRKRTLSVGKGGVRRGRDLLKGRRGHDGGCWHRSAVGGSCCVFAAEAHRPAHVCTKI